ncbi:hypothetical protein RRG08_041342 [Elysia crispata]|uniref:Uncharacterized protein n=1 Tax=Elysia crispata TaxID=231223 RepID=A0AAE1BA96_9GAST|nr:hypothetical protein RRG08_041342 [Elysia crispata]
MLKRDIAVRSTRSEITTGQVISFKFLVDIQWFNVLTGCGVVSSGCESKYATAEESTQACSAAERKEDGGGRTRDSETLIINTVYGLVGDVAKSRDAPNRGKPSDANQISISNNHS